MTPPAPDSGGHELGVYHELCGYTLGLMDVAFTHQHVVDAWAVQRATAASKPIGVAFGLAGLYLHLERGYTGREVQLAHMRMGRARRAWPAFNLPANRGAITALDVMAVPPGPGRSAAIDRWCGSVWEAVKVDCRPAVVALLAEYNIT